MGKSSRIEQSTNDKSILLDLKQEQEQHSEGSKAWMNLQEKINQIVAQNYLEYVNR